MFGPAGNRRLNAREQLLQRQRAADDVRQDLQRYTRDLSTMSAVNHRGDKVAGRIRTNQSAIRATEAMFAEQRRNRERELKRRERQAAQEESLAEALAQRQTAEEARLREIQQICESDPMLRELQEKIKTAYINKERADQVVERTELDQMEAERRAAIEAQMEHDRRLGLEEEAAQEYKRRLNQLDARKVIEHQMLEKERRKFFQGEEEARRDKMMIDGIVSKIMQEDRAEIEDKHRRQAESQKFINDFKEQQAAWKRAQAEAEAEEERNILEYARAKEAREAHVAAKKAEADAEAAAVYGRLVEEQKERQRQLDEEENLRMLLAEEETEARLEAQEAARRAKKAADLKAMMDANAAQTKLKEWRASKEREEEEKQRALLKQKYDEDERMEREAARRRAQAKVEYMESVEAQKREMHRLFEIQRQEELEFARREKLKEDYRARVVEEARRKLLMEHAAALQGYLPKGVLQSREDLDLIRQAGGGR